MNFILHLLTVTLLVITITAETPPLRAALGGAAYGPETYHQKNEANEPSASTLANPSHTATGQSTAATTTATPGASSSIPGTNTSKDHHYGKDAVVAGGAAYEAEKHHKHDRDLTQAEKDAKKEHKHDVKEAKKEREDSKGGLLGFLREYFPHPISH